MTAFLGKKNNATSKVATVGGIDNSTNPITFAVTTGEGSKFPAANFVITIDNEILLCTSRTGDNLTCTRAYEGTTIAAHSQNADVELRITAGTLEEYEKISNLHGMDFAADNQTSDTYEVTLAPAPTAYFTGMVVKFKANTLNTGACTLNVNSLGAKTLKKNVTADLETGDILANQIVTVIYDGTNFQVLSKLSGVVSFSSNFLRQALINPNCQVNQVVNAVNLTSGKLFGSVDMFYAKGAGTAVSAGTIGQTTSANCGNSGYALKLAGVTLTGTGLVHAYTFIESINAKLYKNKTASFSVKVYHDVGSAINYTIKINKANSANNFSAVTEIAAASAQSVPNTTETLIKFENVSLGDCSNGIEIEISAACGAITTKNFEFTDWQFNEGSVVLPFVCKDFGEELNNCLRYIYVPDTSAAGSHVSTGKGFSSTGSDSLLYFPIPMMKGPTLIATAGDWSIGDSASAYDLTGISLFSSNKNKCLIRCDVSGGGLTQFRFYNLASDDTANRIMILDARPTIA